MCIKYSSYENLLRMTNNLLTNLMLVLYINMSSDSYPNNDGISLNAFNIPPCIKYFVYTANNKKSCLLDSI